MSPLNTKRFGIALAIVASICLICIKSPTFDQQVPFNQWVWEHHPVRKIKYYMSDSVVAWLNTEHPTYDEVLAKLGDGVFWQAPDQSQLTYWLKSPYIIGLAMYTLEIDFDDDGSVKEASVVFSD